MRKLTKSRKLISLLCSAAMIAGSFAAMTTTAFAAETTDRNVPEGATNPVDFMTTDAEKATEVVDGTITRSALKVSDLTTVDSAQGGKKVIEISGDPFKRGSVILTLEYDMKVENGESATISLYKNRNNRMGPRVKMAAADDVTTVTYDLGTETAIETTKALEAGKWYRITQTTLPDGKQSIGGVQIEIYELTNGEVGDRLATVRAGSGDLNKDGDDKVTIDRINIEGSVGDAMIDNFHAYTPVAKSATIKVVENGSTPVEGAKVVLDDPHTGEEGITTTETGEVTFNDLIAAPYTITVTKSAYVTATDTIDLATETEKTITLEGNADAVAVTSAEIVYTTDGTDDGKVGEVSLSSGDLNGVMTGDKYKAPSKYKGSYSAAIDGQDGLYSVYEYVSGLDEPVTLDKKDHSKIYVTVKQIPGKFYYYDDFEGYATDSPIRSEERGVPQWGADNDNSVVAAGPSKTGNVILFNSETSTWTANQTDGITGDVEISYQMHFPHYENNNVGKTMTTTLADAANTPVVQYVYDSYSHVFTSLKIGDVEKITEENPSPGFIAPGGNGADHRDYNGVNAKYPTVTISIIGSTASITFTYGTDSATYSGDISTTNIKTFTHSKGGISSGTRLSAINNFAVKVYEEPPVDFGEVTFAYADGKVTVTAANDVDGESADVIVACYADDDTLSTAKVYTVTFDGNTATQAIEDEIHPGDKIMVWNSISGSKPFADAYEVPAVAVD